MCRHEVFKICVSPQGSIQDSCLSPGFYSRLVSLPRVLLVTVGKMCWKIYGIYHTKERDASRWSGYMKASRRVWVRDYIHEG